MEPRFVWGCLFAVNDVPHLGTVNRVQVKKEEFLSYVSKNPKTYADWNSDEGAVTSEPFESKFRVFRPLSPHEAHIFVRSCSLFVVGAMSNM
jgi:hypothetical protein